jgi:hypothetical protein
MEEEGHVGGAHSGGPESPAPRVEGAKWVLQTLALPVALVVLPLVYQWKASEIAEKARSETRQRELADQQFRLYTDLMSKREDSDTQVRRGLFEKLMGSYLAPSAARTDKRLVALELLSVNFHETINLSPLFWDLAHDIEKAPPGPARNELTAELDRIARQAKDRQAAVLEVDGARQDWDVDLAAVVPGTAHPMISFDLPRIRGNAVKVPALRHFNLTVMQHDRLHRRLLLVVESPDRKRVEFWLDPYDFPLVNFSRVSDGERFAVMMRDYDARDEAQVASLTFLYFPSGRAGAKDKPYLDDLMARLHVATPSAEANAAGSATER